MIFAEGLPELPHPISIKRHTEAVQHSSENPNWRTPSDLFRALSREFHFTLDAAANKVAALCTEYLGPGLPSEEHRNALTVDWYQMLDYQKHGRAVKDCAIFLNNPYSRTISAAYRSGKIKRNGDWEPHPKNLALADAYTMDAWMQKCWHESQAGCTIVGVVPYSPQTSWWRRYIEGNEDQSLPLSEFHAASEVRRIPHRVSFLREDGTEADNAGGNTTIVVWRPKHGKIAPWVPWSYYWDYREAK